MENKKFDLLKDAIRQFGNKKLSPQESIVELAVNMASINPMPLGRLRQESHLKPRPKKFKPSQSFFRPLPVEENDELFANGIFDFNITKLLAFIRLNPDQFVVEGVEIKPFRQYSPESLNESTVQTADLSSPIILAEISPGRFNVIDGNHRLEKAYRDGFERLPAIKLNAEQHIAFLTSERAYKIYAEYWNSKIDEK